MTTEITKKCKDCGIEYPETREYFGQYKNRRDDITKIGFRNTCRKCMAKRTAKHSSDNADLVKKRLSRRKELEDNALGYHTDSDLRNLRNELLDQCRFCGNKLDGGGEIEHLTPLSRGGTNHPENITLACLRCNREKTNKTLEEYLDWRAERGLHNRDISPQSEHPDVPTTSKGRNTYNETDTRVGGFNDQVQEASAHGNSTNPLPTTAQTIPSINSNETANITKDGNCSTPLWRKWWFWWLLLPIFIKAIIQI